MLNVASCAVLCQTLAALSMVPTMASLWSGARVVDPLQVLAGDVSPAGMPPHHTLQAVLRSIPSTLSMAEFATLRAILITFISRTAAVRGVPERHLTRALEICYCPDASTLAGAVERAFAELGCFADSQSMQSDPRVMLALGYIRCHATRGRLNVAAVAAQVRLSRWHLERLMRLCTGRPPTAHIRETRMLAGRRMLDRTALAVKQIAAESGYANASAFSRDFKRTFGMTPLEWRNRSAARLPE